VNLVELLDLVSWLIELNLVGGWWNWVSWVVGWVNLNW
jgi:hypothetical protein